MSLLIDTGCIFALLNSRDAGHAAAQSLFADVAAGTWGTPVVSDLIVVETLTLIRARTSNTLMEQRAAELLGLRGEGLPGLRLVSLPTTQLSDAWGLFERHRDRRLSFTDACSLALLREFGVDRLATFDRGFRGLCPTVPG